MGFIYTQEGNKLALIINYFHPPGLGYLSKTEKLNVRSLYRFRSLLHCHIYPHKLQANWKANLRFTMNRRFLFLEQRLNVYLQGYTPVCSAIPASTFQYLLGFP
jgi:hypothetical protein